MSRIATTHANQFWPFLRYFEREGLDYSSYLKRHRMPNAMLHDPNTKIATLLVYQCIDDMAKREQLPDFGWQVGVLAGYASLAGIAAHALKEPTVGKVIAKLTTLAKHGGSNAELFTKENSQGIELCHLGGVALDTPGYFQVESYMAAALVAIVQAAVGPNDYRHCPKLRLRHPIPRSFKPTALKRTTLEGDSNYTAVTIPAVLLNQANAARKEKSLGDLSPQAGIQGQAYIKSKNPLILNLCEVMTPYIKESSIPSIAFIAEQADMNVRTLQRELRERGSSYRDLVLELKLGIAREKLSQTSDSIHSIAENLGYKHSNHFTRAFKNYFNETPRQLRKSLPKNKPIKEASDNR